MKSFAVAVKFIDSSTGNTQTINYSFRIVPVVTDTIHLPGWGIFTVVSRVLIGDETTGPAAYLGLKEKT